jgi:hypothetical protein
MLLRALAILVLSVGTVAGAAEVSFGPLPAGVLSTNVVSEVGAEICRDHLFDPSLVRPRLPEGYRLILAAEYSRDDPAVAELLQRHPQYATHAVGSLCFMSVGSFVVDGVRINSTDPTPMAFRWTRAAGPRDPRMQGKAEWVQLASWYSKAITQRERVLATDPMAQFVDLDMTRTGTNDWRLRLILPGESIEAEVQGDGKRRRRKAPEPGFMSVPLTGAHAGSFWIFTYFGHHHQSAQGQWRAPGTGVFHDALQIPGESAAFNTLFQDGWSALSGLYAP